MAVDRCRALKLEDAPYGTATDLTPTEVAPNSDGMDARAYFVQSASSADGAAFVSRTANDLTLTDPNAGTKAAADLVTRSLGSVAAHQALPDMAHFMGAPVDGWATPYYTEAYNGPLLTAATWWTSAGQTRAIFRQAYAYAGPCVAQVVSTVFDAAGAQVRQVTDTYNYAGPILANIVRSWT